MSDQPSISASEVVEFLRHNPSFFEAHTELLLSLEVPHPHGGRTVSIPERQLIATREKVKLLESKLGELIGFGTENDALSAKVHALTMRLIEAPSLNAAIDTLYLDLLDHFQIPHVAVRFWNVVVPEASAAPEFKGTGAEITQFVDSMTEPYCGTHAVYETSAWFGEHAAHLKSYAIAPLRVGTGTDATRGVVIFASENSERFYAGMGTMFLTRVADVFAHVITRWLAPSQAPRASA